MNKRKKKSFVHMFVLPISKYNIWGRGGLKGLIGGRALDGQKAPNGGWHAKCNKRRRSRTLLSIRACFRMKGYAVARLQLFSI